MAVGGATRRRSRLLCWRGEAARSSRPARGSTKRPRSCLQPSASDAPLFCGRMQPAGGKLRACLLAGQAGGPARRQKQLQADSIPGRVLAARRRRASLPHRIRRPPPALHRWTARRSRRRSGTLRGRSGTAPSPRPTTAARWARCWCTTLPSRVSGRRVWCMCGALARAGGNWGTCVCGWGGGEPGFAQDGRGLGGCTCTLLCLPLLQENAEP